MDSRTTELLDHLDRTRRALRDAVDRVPPALRERRPEPDRWSVAEVLEHLSLVERRMTAMLRARLDADRAIAGGPASSGPASGAAARGTASVVGSIDAARLLDRTRRREAREGLRPEGTLGADGALAALEEARDRLREVVVARDGMAPGEFRFEHPAVGAMDVDQIVAFVGLHEQRHTAQIGEIADALAGPVS